MVTSPSRDQDLNQENMVSGKAAPMNLGVVTDLPKTPLFGTDGIRGKAGELLSASLALQIGFWAGQVFQNVSSSGGVVILGQDSRNSSDMLANALSSGLTSAGLNVWNVGLCPTPCVAHLTAKTNATGGIMISASHNPPEDNGIKFFGQDGLKLSPQLQQQIESGLRGASEIIPLHHNWGNHYNRPAMVKDYVHSLRQSLPSGINLQGQRIILDLAWGASTEVAPLVFKDLGAEVICLHKEPNGDRINVGCGSTHLSVLQEAIAHYQADMGFAFDGDADRVMAVDGQGRVIDGDYILYLWGKHLQERGQLPGNLIVATVMANLGFERAWRKLGGDLIRTKVGDQHVQEAMWNTGAKLGGEQSGHILCHHHSYSGDGLQTAIHIATLVHQSGLSLTELINDSFEPYPQLLCNVFVEDRERRRHWQDCQPLQDAIALAESAMGEDGRILVRASGTEPVIRVMVEAASADLAKYWSEELVNVVQKHLA